MQRWEYANITVGTIDLTEAAEQARAAGQPLVIERGGPRYVRVQGQRASTCHTCRQPIPRGTASVIDRAQHVGKRRGVVMTISS